MPGEQPLRGRRIAVTRARDRAGELAGALAAAGADVVFSPLTRIDAPADPAPLGRAAASAADYDWIVFTSATAVDRFWDALPAGGGESLTRADAGSRVEPRRRSSGRRPRFACVGPGTAAALERRGARADVVPEDYVAEALAAELSRRIAGTAPRVLWPRAAGARPVLARALREHGAELDEVEAYRTVPAPGPAAELRRLLDKGALDVVTFLAASAVESFADAVGRDTRPAVVAVIGPATAEAARRRGLPVHVVAEEHTIPGLVRALLEYFQERSR